ncbi:MAG: hypothetical protein K2W82_17155 [Candidatus Obscuribacterales bacterium]|nr:hypothetical protein [Candidatus Obscuribacterales bacterium]
MVHLEIQPEIGGVLTLAPSFNPKTDWLLVDGMGQGGLPRVVPRLLAGRIPDSFRQMPTIPLREEELADFNLWCQQRGEYRVGADLVADLPPRPILLFGELVQSPGSTPEKPFLEGTIDWSKIEYWCSDVHCPCGEHTHHCTSRNGPARHFRCRGCAKVYAFDDKVRLLTDSVSKNPHSLQDVPNAYVQWKGAHLEMSAGCYCGHRLSVSGDFAYELDCPRCREHYFVDWYVAIRELQDDEAAKVEKIHEYSDEEE